jgi:hypothetical protein
VQGTSKNTGSPWKHRLRLIAWPVLAIANDRVQADFSRCSALTQIAISSQRWLGNSRLGEIVLPAIAEAP